MPKTWLASIAVLMAGLSFPVMGAACDWSDRQRCRDLVRQLITYRSEAIEYAFGDVFGALPPQIEIRFVLSDDTLYRKFSGRLAYDQSQRMLVVPRRYIDSKMPMPLRWAASYWPYYRNRDYRETFPIIEAIDNALWGAVLQETAQARGLSWPHEGCRSMDLAKRLPCEMLIAGIAAYVTEWQAGVFNANRVDRIWPEDFTRFEQGMWRSEREYVDVQRYGGILLLRPLFAEFGVPKAMIYVAQTPFLVENHNMRASAQRYQERARQALVMTQGPAAPIKRATEEAPAKPPAATNPRDRRFVAVGLAGGET